MRTACVLLGVLACVQPVRARADDEREALRKKQDLEQLERNLPDLPPEPGRDKAPVRPPPWCANASKEGSWSPSSIARSIESARRNGWSEYFTAAMVTCFFPDEPAVQKAAQVIEQSWINLTGLSEAEALESFKARMNKERFAADKTKLCDALEVSDEIDGEEKSFMLAKRVLFGCAKKGWADKTALWGESGAHVPDDLVTFVDLSANEPDELVRLALIVDHAAFGLGEKGDFYNHALLSYVTDQLDFQALSPRAAMKLLDAEPYQNNSYARAVVLESLGRAKMSIAAIAKEVDKRASDADWKELLVTAPQRGAADWKREASTHQDALARSNEFEHKFWGPSRRALKGCWAPLEKDFVGVARTLKRSSEHEFKEQLSDPIASLLFMRVATCAAVDGDKHYAQRLLRIASELRAARGPRLAAYYSALDALNQILADRTKFPVSAHDFWFVKSHALYDAAFDAASKGSSGAGYAGDSAKGIVKSARKSGGGVEIAFATQKHQEMGRSCVETNRILTFRADGSPLYYQKCHDTGLITVDDTAQPITVPAAWAGGIVPGALVEFDAAIGKPPTRIALPKAVYSDKSKKKLVGYYGFAL